MASRKIPARKIARDQHLVLTMQAIGTCGKIVSEEFPAQSLEKDIARVAFTLAGGATAGMSQKDGLFLVARLLLRLTTGEDSCNSLQESITYYHLC